MAAVLALGRDAVASHRSAAWLWGVSSKRPSTIDVTVARRVSSRDSFRVHYAPLSCDDRAWRVGIPVATLSRTLLDLATSSRPETLERALEVSERLGLLDLRAVEGVLVRSVGHPGAGRLRRALAACRPPRITRSELERRFLRILREAGLPMPATNVFIEGYELDAFWPGERFAVELDGYEFHRTRAAFERDRRRQEDLKVAGVEMIRVTARRLDEEPSELAARIALLLGRRRAGPHRSG